MVYIKQQDYDKWLLLEKKSEFIHNALNGVTMDIHPEMHAQPSKRYEAPALRPRPLSEVVKDEDIFGSLNPDNLVFTGDAVYDKTTGEREKVTPEMVKELKRRATLKT